MKPFSQGFIRKAPGIFFPIILVLAFYAWTGANNRTLYRQRILLADHYALLVDGFFSGHLYLSCAPSGALLALPNPYDPAGNANLRLHDASLYRGKYYLYFSPVPAVSLLAPWKLITGRALPQYWAVFLFAGIGFIATLRLLQCIRDDHFPDIGPWTFFGSCLLAGLLNWCPVLLRRAGVWEMPISSGYAFAMLSVLLIYESLRRPNPIRCLVAASLCYALAIASRAVYLPGIILFIFPLACFTQRLPLKNTIGFFIATATPLAAVAAALLAYNYLRFDDPLEFGRHYQLTAFDERSAPAFSLHYFLPNLRTYFLQPAHFSQWFPFFKIGDVPEMPKGQFGVEEMYSIIPNMPFTILAGFSPVMLLIRRKFDSMSAILAALLTLVVSISCILLLFGGMASRYLVEILCALTPLAVLSFWHVSSGLTKIRYGRIFFVTSAGVLAAYSTFFVFCANIQHKELLQTTDPVSYAKLAHAFDRLSTGHPSNFGPLQLKIKLPTGRFDQIEPLISTGWGSASDVLYICYYDAKNVQLVFLHSQGHVLQSPIIPIDYGHTHILRVDMGSLYPPRAHPYFDRFETGTADAIASHLHVTLDSTICFDESTVFHDADSRGPLIGTTNVTDVLGRKFQVSQGQLREPFLFTGEMIDVGTIPIKVPPLTAPSAR